MAIMLAISGRPPFAVDAETITIGAEPGSTIAFPDDERIKPRHAQIRRVAGRWMVEAREGETIQVGSAAPARVHWLNPGDVIHLVEDGPKITFEPKVDEPITLKPSARAESKPPPAAPAVAQPAERPARLRPTSAPALRKNESYSGGDEGLVPPPISPLELADVQTPPAREKPRVRPLPKLWNEPKRSPAAQALSQNRIGWMAISIGVAVLVAVVAACIWFGSRPAVDDSRPSAVPDKKSKQGPALAETAREDNDGADDDGAGNDRAGGNEVASDGGTPSSPAEGRPDKVAPASVTHPSADDVQHSLYAVTVHDAEKKNTFRLGTAWAVAPRRLVTSGAVVVALEELLKSGVTVFVSPAGEQREIRVTGMRVHPRYRQAADEAAAARGDVEKLNAGQSAGPAEKLLQEARDRLAAAYAAEVEVDLGILETVQLPAHVLRWESKAAADLSQGEYVMVGLPFSIGEYRSTEPVSSQPEEREGSDPATTGALFTIKFRRDVAGQNWSGSPLFNAAFAVAGVYSRPIEEGEEAQGRGTGTPTAHAVAPIGRLREFVPDLK